MLAQVNRLLGVPDRIEDRGHAVIGFYDQMFLVHRLIASLSRAAGRRRQCGWLARDLCAARGAAVGRGADRGAGGRDAVPGGLGGGATS